MGLAETRAKDAARSAYMKDKGPYAFRNALTRPTHPETKMAQKLGSGWAGRYSSTWERGYLGGVLVSKLGMSPVYDSKQKE